MAIIQPILCIGKMTDDAVSIIPCGRVAGRSSEPLPLLERVEGALCPFLILHIQRQIWPQRDRQHPSRIVSFRMRLGMLHGSYEPSLQILQTRSQQQQAVGRRYPCSILTRRPSS